MVAVVHVHALKRVCLVDLLQSFRPSTAPDSSDYPYRLPKLKETSGSSFTVEAVSELIREMPSFKAARLTLPCHSFRRDVRHPNRQNLWSQSRHNFIAAQFRPRQGPWRRCSLRRTHAPILPYVLPKYQLNNRLQYRDPDVVSKIKSVTGDSIHLGLDTISTTESQILSVKTFAPGPGKLNTILSNSAEAQKLREDVKFTG